MIRIYSKLERVMDHPNTQTLFNYWDELRAGRDAPSRSEIDPRRISGALETMFILEKLEDGQFRFRLAGTRLCEMLGMEARGLTAEAVMASGHGDQMADLAERVLEHPGVGVMAVRAMDGSGVDWSGEVLMLPLRSELGDMTRIVGAVNFTTISRGARPEPNLRLRCLGTRLLPIEVDHSQSKLPAPLAPAAATTPAVAGFAEPGHSFDRRPMLESRPSLTAIEGNPEAPAVRRSRPNLRIVE